MKARTIVQFNEKEIIAEDIVKTVKEDMKAQNIKVTHIETLDMYLKLEESKVYYVATLKDGTEVKGSVAA